MKNSLEYKILKFLSEKDNGTFIDVSLLSENKIFLKSKLVELRSNGHIKTNFGEYNLSFGDGEGIKNEINFSAKITLVGNRFLNEIEQNKHTSIVNDFSGSTIGQLNQS